MNFVYIPSSSSSDDDDYDDYDIDCEYLNCFVNRRKTVGFSEAEPSIIPILNEDEWYQDYYDSRCGGTYLLDKARFMRRIRDVSDEISWIFSNAHREKIKLCFV